MSDGGGPGYQEFEYYIKLNKLLVLTGVSFFIIIQGTGYFISFITER